MNSALLTAEDPGAERTVQDNASLVPLHPAPAEDSRPGILRRIRFAFLQFGPLMLPPPPTSSPPQVLPLTLALVESGDPVRPVRGIDTPRPALLPIQVLDDQQRLVVGSHATRDRSRSCNDDEEGTDQHLSSTLSRIMGDEELEIYKTNYEAMVEFQLRGEGAILESKP